MTTKKVNGNLPINARINIKYNDNKPTIKFSYPDKNSQVRGSMLFEWRAFLGISSLLITYRSYVSMNAPTNFIPLKVSAYLLFLLFIYYGFSFVTYHIPPIKNTLEKLYPKYQALTSRKKLAIFKPKDVKINEEGIYCEIPVFNNIICDFKCNGEFSDYLNEIDIREHKFVYYRKKPKKPKKLNPKEINRYKRKIIKWKGNKINEWLWYARWYFTKKPEKGYMEVIFK